MESMQDYAYLLIFIGGVSWLTIYAEAVRVGLRDNSYALPLWAVGLSFSWELIHTFLIGRAEGASFQVVIVGIRALLAIAVLSTWFKFGVKHFPSKPGESWFVPWSLLVIVVSFVLHSAFVMQFGVSPGLAYSAALQILAMSLLFISMLTRRKTRRGQSMIIAVAKLTASLALTIHFGVLGVEALGGPNNLILTIGTLSCLFDLIYLLLLSDAKPYEKREQEEFGGRQPVRSES